VPAHDFIWRASAMTGWFCVVGCARLRRAEAAFTGLRAGRGWRGRVVIAAIRSAG
jgi:hypothetical protein